MGYTENLRARLRAFENRTIPQAWKQVVVVPVGGLTAVGYAAQSDLLLVVSHAGRGLFDALSGERVARDDSGPGVGWLNEIPYEATGMGPLTNSKVRLAGILGGGLARVTNDRWSLEAIPVDWPHHIVFVVPPGSNIFLPERASSCARIDVTEELRAVGFSETGQSFVIATSSDLTLYARIAVNRA